MTPSIKDLVFESVTKRQRLHHVLGQQLSLQLQLQQMIYILSHVAEFFPLRNATEEAVRRGQS